MSTTSLLAGVAGEYFVAAELLRRGVIASTTLRITRGFDIVVTNKDATKPVIIQCKTSPTTKRSELDFYPTRHPLAAPAHEQSRRPRSAAAVRLTPPQLPWVAGIFLLTQAYRSYTFGRQWDG